MKLEEPLSAPTSEASSQSEDVFPKNFPPLLKKWLHSRGFSDAEAIQKLLYPKLKDLADPTSLLNLQKAARRLVEARGRGETVALFGDFDLDGTTGLLVLYEGLQALGFSKLLTAQPSRLQDGYGLSTGVVEKFHHAGATVLVSVDVGTNAVEAGRRCHELGIDFIVADHHLAGGELAQAFALINPNQGQCQSGLGHLAGCGVGFYLVLGVRQEMRTQGLDWQGLDPKTLLDLVTIGTLTDLTALKAENRILMKHGLYSMGQSQRPAIREMVARAVQSDTVGSMDVAFQIAPRLNALSRLEQGLSPFDFLKERNSERVSKLASEVWKANELRKELQTQAYQKSLQKLANQSGVPWVWDESFHKGVIGLVATKLSQEKGGGAFVGALDLEKGQITGSARLVEGHPGNLSEILARCAEVLESYGGHAAAAGFRLKSENAAAFGALLEREFQKFRASDFKVFDVSSLPKAELSEMTSHLAGQISLLEPFGKGFPYPQFLLEGLEVTGVVRMKGGHLRLKVKQEGRFEVKEILRFGPLPSEAQVEVGVVIDAVIEPQFNWYLGQKRLQLSCSQFRVRD